MIPGSHHRSLPISPTSPFPISFEEIITGERLQAIADVTVITEQKARFHKSCPVMRLAHFSSGLAPNEAGLAALNEARVVFVYSDMIDDFLGKIFPLLKQPIVLITHNSDASVDERYGAALDNPQIISWFAQNVKLDHPKLTALPIGIANAQWRHGDVAALARVAARAHPWRSGLYVNFEVSTNPKLLGPLLEALRTKRFSVMGRRRPLHSHILQWVANLCGVSCTVNDRLQPYPAYLADMAQWRFCVSPPGNGIDCHRTWEALYLGVIPVVVSSAGGLLDHLPCIIVDDIAAVTPEGLEAALLNLNGPFAWGKLTLSYWRKRIRYMADQRDNSTLSAANSICP